MYPDGGETDGREWMAEFVKRTTAPVSPAYEDAGLFKNEICEVVVWLVPIVHTTRRGDVQATGFIDDTLEVPVLFAGRRVAQARQLLDRLSALKTEVMQDALRKDKPPPFIESIRLPVWISGAWRARFMKEPDGCVTRSYHMVAAKWRFEVDGGKVVEQGTEPKK